MKEKNPFLSNVLFFIALIVAFNVFPPIGIIMILYKFGLFKKLSTSKNVDSVSQRSLRMDKYKIMVEGRNAESIDYLASAVGVSYDTALHDLQQMVSDGQLGADAYINYVDRTLVLVPFEKTAESAANSTKSKTAKSNAKKETGQAYEGTRRMLLIAGIVLLGAGIWRLKDPVDWLIWLGVDTYTLAEMIPGVLMTATGVLSFVFRGMLKKRATRYKVYESACVGRDYISLSELAAKTGTSVRKVRRDLDAMIDKGLFGESAYIDVGDSMLILKPGASPQVEDEPEPPEDGEDRYRSIIKEIRDLNDAIPDPDITRKIDVMEDLTSKIFKAVEDNPEKLPQIKSFMSYYLPTTLKLLRSYADFERSGADGDNVKSAKAEIERILDTLVDGFKKQLDKLYETEAMDISSDIDVLENMLRKDGLAGDGSSFGTTARG